MRNTIKNHIDFAMAPADLTSTSPFFIVRAKPAKFPDDPRYGLVVTKKTFKLAVHRNRAKRVIRDWIAFNEKWLDPRFDYVFICRRAILDTTREDGRVSMARALRFLLREYKRATTNK